MSQHLILDEPELTIGLSLRPTTLGHTLVTLKQSSTTDLFSLPSSSFVTAMLKTRDLAAVLRTFYHVRRCALITEGGNTLSIFPLHGLSENWQPIYSATKEFNETFPGYISSIDGPQMNDARLDEICFRIRAAGGFAPPFDYRFNGDPSDSNLFACIIRGGLQQWRVWEDERHVAFLTPFANTPGFTVLVPRAHLSSDIFSLSETDYAALVEAAWIVAGILKKAFEMRQCGMVFEGFEIDYAHVKLIPGRKATAAVAVTETPAANESKAESAYSEEYQGYVTSLPGPLAKDVESLAKDAFSIRDSLRENII